MMQDSIEFVDREYGVVNKDRRLSSNQIKTRKTSFENIKQKWVSFRLSLLTKKLDRLKQEIVTQKFVADKDSRISGRTEDKLLRKTTAIARIEQKIKILSREDVPTDYVSNRAIKLKKKMMDNLTYNSGNAYSVGLDKMDEVFDEEVSSDVLENVEPIVNPVSNVVESVDPSKENVENIQVVSPEDVDAIVKGIQNVDEEGLKEKDISDIIGNKLDSISTEEPVEESIDEPVKSDAQVSEDNPVDVKDISNTILGAVKSVDPSSMFTFNPGSSTLRKFNPNSSMFTYGSEHVSSLNPDAKKEDELSDSEIEQRIVEAMNSTEINPSVTNDVEEEYTADDIKKEIDAALARLKVSHREGKTVDFKKFDSVDDKVADSSRKFEFGKGSMFEFPVVTEDTELSVLEQHKNEFIPGTDIFKPRDRGVYESDEDYVEFLRKYYEAAFAKPAKKSRDTYKPMTAEEIQRSREKIEYDKYEKVYADEWQKAKARKQQKPNNFSFEVPSFKSIFHPAQGKGEIVFEPKVDDISRIKETQIRDYPVIVPERDLPMVVKKDNLADYDIELPFGHSDITSNISSTTKSGSSIDGFKELSARVKELQEKKKQQLQRQQRVQSDALQTEDYARKVKLSRKKASEAYSEKMRRLEEYTRMLADQCSDIENETQVVSDSVAASRRFIEEQEAQARSYEELNGQIDEILSGDLSVHKGRR